MFFQVEKILNRDFFETKSFAFVGSEPKTTAKTYCLSFFKDLKYPTTSDDLLTTFNFSDTCPG